LGYTRAHRRAYSAPVGSLTGFERGHFAIRKDREGIAAEGCKWCGWRESIIPLPSVRGSATSTQTARNSEHFFANFANRYIATDLTNRTAATD